MSTATETTMEATMAEPSLLYGTLAEFENTGTLVKASQALYERGYRRIEAYTPFPVEGLADAIGFHRTRLPFVVLCGAIAGAIAGFALQWWVSVVAYPLNIGGRPLNSWPSFVPVTFEVTILVAALSAVLGMLALNGLPRPHHPLFGVPAFSRASTDGYFLCVQAEDPLFHEQSTVDLLKELHAKETWNVPALH